MNETHLGRLLAGRIAARGDEPALRFERGGALVDLSWREVGREVESAARALVSAGIGEGDRVGLLAPNRPEWTIADLALQRVRAVSVPIHVTSTGEQSAFILRDAGARLLLAGREEDAARVAAHGASLPELARTVTFAAEGEGSWRAFLDGSRDDAAAGAEVAARLARATGDDLLTLIYTSGTTGEPKGVMLTHGGCCAAVRYHDERLIPIGPGDVSLSFLPLSHVFERAFSLYVLYRGAVSAYCEDPKRVVELLGLVRPTTMCAVPRLYEKVAAGIRHRAESAGPLARTLFARSVAAGRSVATRRRQGRRVGPLLALRHAVADRLVLRKIRAVFGGRARMLPCAGAALSPEVEALFHAAGLFVIVGYGLTETTATVTCYEASRFTPGTVGKPLPGVEVRISDEGEILVRGETVMRGYWNRPDATAEVLGSDGWFRTGDAGRFLPDGSLVITERIKDLFKTSGGKYVAPQAIESALGADRFVEQSAAFGDGRRYVTALVVPAFEALEEWARERGVAFASREALVANPDVLALYRRRIDAATTHLAKHEQVVRFTLLPRALSAEEGEVTATLKIRRRVAEVRYADEIEAMYRD